MNPLAIELLGKCIDLNVYPSKSNIKEILGISYTGLLRKGVHLQDICLFLPVVDVSQVRYCKVCSVEFTVLRPADPKVFCSRSCSATFNNTGLDRKSSTGTTRVYREKKYCPICGKNCRHTYCSLNCMQKYAYSRNIAKWLAGEIAGWTGKTKNLCKFIRRWLHETRGTACSECGWDKKHPVDGAILTEIDHVDGDAENCRPENLKILCPNCHSMTPTFRARNKNSKRGR